MRRSVVCLALFFIFPLMTAQPVAALEFPEVPAIPSVPWVPNVSLKLPAFKLPKDAVKITDELYKLHQALDSDSGLNVEAYAIVHKKNSPQPRIAESHRSNARRRQASCYGFFANGAKWKTVEPWVVNASGSGLVESFVVSNLATNIAKWEDATDGLVGNGGLNVLGDGSATNLPLTADASSPDNVNEVYFGSVDDPDTIAVTIVWGYWGGLVSQRRIVEWDQIYSTGFPWSATGEVSKMDFENIASHELGHSVGLIDLYNSACFDETMYGYATEGETKKRDLNIGDITGMNKLY